MSSLNYFDEMKKIQDNLLVFIEDDSNNAQNLQNLNSLFEDHKILTDEPKLFSFLYLILKIANNHKRGPLFFTKIKQIFQILKSSIKNFLTNYQIFNIFKNNNRFLLFLIEEKIIEIDERITKKIMTTEKYIKAQYPQYFAPEIKPLINKLTPTENKYDLFNAIKGELPENFIEERKTGENDNHICKLIRQDSLEEFIQYSNEYCPIIASIKPSFYETNDFLLKQINTTLI